MRSLFLKIFIWFWLLMALMVLAHALSTAMTEPDNGPVRGVESALVMYGLTAVEKYERDGKSAVGDYVDLLRRTARIRAHLFDGDGYEVSGREATPDEREIAYKLIAGTDDRFSRAGQTGVVAKKITAPSGKQFVIVGEVQRPVGVLLPFWLPAW